MAGVGDVPRKCDRCSGVTLHRPDETGAMHCMPCLTKGVTGSAPSEPRPIATSPIVGAEHPKFCATCKATVTHVQYNGVDTCLRCAERDPGASNRQTEWERLPPHVQQQYWQQHQQQAAPQVVHVHHKPKSDGVMVGTMKLAGFIVSLIFLLALGTCVYVCGSAASSKKQGRIEVRDVQLLVG